MKDNTIPEDFEEDTDNILYSTAIERAQYGNFHYIILTLCGIISATIVVPGNSLSEARQIIACELLIDRKDQVWFNNCTVLALITGGLIIGIASDYIGRIKPLILSLVLYGLSTLGLGFSKEFYYFTTLSLLRAFWTSAVLCILTVTVVEVQAPKYRGSGLCFLQMFWSVGLMTMPASRWQVCQYICGTVALIIACVISHFCKESPRFLLSRGRIAEALESLKKIFSLNTGQKKEDYPVKNLIDDVSVNHLKMSQFQTSICPPWYCTIVSIQATFMFNLCYFMMSWWFPEMSCRYALLFPVTRVPLKCKYGEISVVQRYLPATLRIFEKDDQLKGLNTCYFKIADNYYYNEVVIVTLATLPFITWMTLQIDHLGRVYFTIFSHVSAGFLSFAIYFLIDTSQSMLYACLMESLSIISFTAVTCLITEFLPTRYRATGVAVLNGFGYVGMIIGIQGWFISQNRCVSIISMLGIILTASGLLTLALPDSAGIYLR